MYIAKVKVQNGKDITQDTLVKNFLKDKVKFASIINAMKFDGKPVIKAQYLHSVDSEVQFVDEVRIVGFNRRRDIVMRYDEGNKHCVFVLEIQSYYDRRMIHRSMQYTIMENDKQLKVLNESYPVYLIVLYTNSFRWSGPTTLIDTYTDGLYFKELGLNNWKMDVNWIKDIDPSKIDDEETRIVFQTVNQIYDSIKEGKRLKVNISRRLFLIAASLIDDKEFMNLIEFNEKEDIVVCDAIDELRNRAKDERSVEIAQKMVDSGRYSGDEIYSLTGLTIADLK